MATRVVPLIIHGEDILCHNEPTKVFLPNPDIPENGNERWLAQGATVKTCIDTVESCAKAFQSWRQTSLDERRALFTTLAANLRSRKDELCTLIRAELQCSEAWAAINVADTIGLVEHVASLSSSPVFSSQSPKIRTSGSLSLVSQAPLGVIIGIAPWNAPAILGMRAVAAAVMAGNSAILKGSELSPRTHYFIAAAFRDSGFPPGVVNFLLHKPEDAAEIFETLISQPDVRKCNFTGSTGVGRHIAMRASYHLKPVLLELGGKNYAVVLEDADLGAAADMILEGALLNSGQICMSTDIVLVSHSVKQALSDLLHAKLAAFSDRHVTRVISRKSEQRIQALVTDAVAKGAVVYTPSTEPNVAARNAQNGHAERKGLRATIIDNLSPDMEFWTEESFGPLLGIAACAGLEDAVKTIGACRYGLSAAIFSRSGLRLARTASQINTGAVHINGATVHDEPVLPHGGCRDSGWGRFGGHWALLEFTQARTVIVNDSSAS